MDGDSAAEKGLSTEGDNVWGEEEWTYWWKTVMNQMGPATVDKNLIKFEDKFFAGRSHVKTFFPLCGKSSDMKWVADKGHEVVGVEFVESTVVEFFEENNLKYTSEKVDSINGILYQSEDKKIRLYSCDINAFSSVIEKDFGAIWDSGSLVAMNTSDLPKYCALMKSISGQDCRYILFTVEYDTAVYPGPPHCTPMEVVKSLLGDMFNIEILLTYDGMENTLNEMGQIEGQGCVGGEIDKDQCGKVKSASEQRCDETMSKMMNLKSMICRYSLLTIVPQK